MRNHRATFASHNIAAAILAFSAFGASAWIPSFFIRHHHWTPALTGQVIGVVIMFSALGCACGGLLADYLAKRGYKDACMRTMLIAALLGIPPTIGYLLVPSAVLSAIILAPASLATAMVFGVAPAALMEFTPARMRGQATALYAFAVNLIGLGVGPTAVALITDYVFHDDNMVGYSLLIVALAAHTTAALILWGGLKPFVRSKNQLAQWGIAQAA